MFTDEDTSLNNEDIESRSISDAEEMFDIEYKISRANTSHTINLDESNMNPLIIKFMNHAKSLYDKYENILSDKCVSSQVYKEAKNSIAMGKLQIKKLENDTSIESFDKIDQIMKGSHNVYSFVNMTKMDIHQMISTRNMYNDLEDLYNDIKQNNPHKDWITFIHGVKEYYDQCKRILPKKPLYMKKYIDIHTKIRSSIIELIALENSMQHDIKSLRLMKVNIDDILDKISKTTVSSIVYKRLCDMKLMILRKYDDLINKYFTHLDEATRHFICKQLKSYLAIHKKYQEIKQHSQKKKNLFHNIHAKSPIAKITKMKTID